MSGSSHTNNTSMPQNQAEPSTPKPCDVADYVYPRALQAVPSHMPRQSLERIQRRQGEMHDCSTGNSTSAQHCLVRVSKNLL